jgi:Flp pilus assembly pilin Flp
MDMLRTGVGLLAAWASRPIPRLQAMLARGPAGEFDPEGGQGLAEYALILALITILAVGALAFVGGNVIGLLTDTVGTGFRYVTEDLLGL